MVIRDVLLVSTAIQIQRNKQDTFKWLHTSYIQLNCQQCSGGSHARQLAAAATMTEAEEFCHCVLSLREAALQTPLNHCAKCEYQCESSNINDAGGPSLFALYIHQLQVKRALHATKQVPRDHWPVPAIHAVLAGAQDFNKCLIIPHGHRMIPVSVKKSQSQGTTLCV